MPPNTAMVVDAAAASSSPPPSVAVGVDDPVASAFGVEPPEELECQMPFRWPPDGGAPAPPDEEEWMRSFLRRLVTASHREPELLALYALRKPDMTRLVGAAKDTFCRSSTVLEVPIPATGRVRVVGDLHGNYHDLVHVLAVAGLPAPDNVYVFAGDYVDRGNWGIEVLLALFALKAWRPASVHLLRGNHETSGCVARYGFGVEAARKYGDKALGGFLAAFRELPIAAVVVSAPTPAAAAGNGAAGGAAAAAAAAGSSPSRRGGRGKAARGVTRPVRRGAGGRGAAARGGAAATDAAVAALPIWERPLVPGERRVLVLHGGIWRDRRSPHAAGGGADRRGALGSLATLAATPRRSADPEGDAVEDALWSDPAGGDGAAGGVAANTLRGAGVFYGAGAAERWLRDNRLAGLIRAHEGPDIRETRAGMADMRCGWAVDMEWPSGAYVATVFSAANYLGRGNDAGVATLAGRADPAVATGGRGGVGLLPVFASYPSRGRPDGEDWACPPSAEERPSTPRLYG